MHVSVDASVYSPERGQKFKFGGTIGYGDSYLEFLFRHSKWFGLHAILHDAAGTVQAHSSKSPSFWYIVGRGQILSLLGQAVGPLSCLYVKLFLPSIFNSVEFWNRMSCIVLDFELAYIKVLRKLGVFFMRKFRGTYFVFRKITNP